MTDDFLLRQRLLDELDWDPALDATQVGIAVDHGSVTLTGHVSSYAQLFAARKAVHRVAGVKAVVDRIEVRLPSGHERADSELAATIAHVLSANVSLPDSALYAETRGGHVTLHGTVDWQQQRRDVEHQIAHVAGVQSITNEIELRSRTRPDDIAARIEEALERNAGFEAQRVKVHVVDGTVYLGGSVKSLYERGLIEMAAWSAPGVAEVVDEIEIE